MKILLVLALGAVVLFPACLGAIPAKLALDLVVLGVLAGHGRSAGPAQATSWLQRTSCGYL